MTISDGNDKKDEVPVMLARGDLIINQDQLGLINKLAPGSLENYDVHIIEGHAPPLLGDLDPVLVTTPFCYCGHAQHDHDHTGVHSCQHVCDCSQYRQRPENL